MATPKFLEPNWKSFIHFLLICTYKYINGTTPLIIQMFKKWNRPIIVTGPSAGSNLPRLEIWTVDQDPALAHWTKSQPKSAS